MRIAWVVYGTIEQTTGGYIYDRLVVERLRALGDDVRVVALDPAPRSHAVAGLALSQRIAELRPDVAVGDELCFREIAPAFAALPRRVARALLVHHLSSWEAAPSPRRSALALWERAALRTSDMHIATSVATATRLRREHGLSRVAVAVPGADRLPRRTRPARDGGPVRLVFVGAFIPRKGLLGLLRAFERAAGDNVTLTLIGDSIRDPEHAATVRRAIAGSAFLRAHVSTPGPVSDEALADALAEADALILPSSLEGYGMVVTEALHAGLPVLASRAGATSEAIRDGVEGLLWEDADGLTQALRRFVGEPPLREQLRLAAEARSGSLPTWQATAETVRAALSRALDEPPSVRAIRRRS